MSFEYKIAFRVTDPTEVKGFLDRLRAQVKTRLLRARLHCVGAYRGGNHDCR